MRTDQLGLADVGQLTPGVMAIMLGEITHFSLFLSVLGAIFIGLSIVKAVLDIRYHPYFKRQKNARFHRRKD